MDERPHEEPIDNPLDRPRISVRLDHTTPSMLTRVTGNQDVSTEAAKPA